MKLNLGCGKDIRTGWINLDRAKLQGVDVIHDLDVLPLPFENNTFDEILCQDVLEHLEIIPIMKELHRILKQNAILKIRVPHFTSESNFTDPTHKTMFSIRKFEFFVKNSEREYYFDFHFSATKNKNLLFRKNWKYPLNKIVESFVNRSYKRMNYYERSGWSRIFPAQNIYIELIK